MPQARRVFMQRVDADEPRALCERDLRSVASNTAASTARSQAACQTHLQADFYILARHLAAQSRLRDSSKSE